MPGAECDDGNQRRPAVCKSRCLSNQAKAARARLWREEDPGYGRNQAVIIHTATGQHLDELHALFTDVIASEKTG